MSGKQYHTPAEWMSTTTKLLSTAERDRAESEVGISCGLRTHLLDNHSRAHTLAL